MNGWFNDFSKKLDISIELPITMVEKFIIVNFLLSNVAEIIIIYKNKFNNNENILKMQNKCCIISQIGNCWVEKAKGFRRR